MTVTANYGSGTSTDVTDTATYSSSNEAVATVSAGGLVTAVGEGSATVTASFEGASGQHAVTVVDTVSGLSVEPASSELDLGS
ncbi:hypothetical protein AN220_00655 [Streptomyces nanshensis]|nr:hypothetical protein AN220_00655 [Streptomyces nanshensis]